jgi:hypothetical protein
MMADDRHELSQFVAASYQRPLRGGRLSQRGPAPARSGGSHPLRLAAGCTRMKLSAILFAQTVDTEHDRCRRKRPICRAQDGRQSPVRLASGHADRVR